MSLRKLNSMIFVALLIAAAVSCKKDEETATIPGLEGNLTFYAPEYIAQNQTLTMVPEGAVNPGGSGVGYSWKVEPSMSKADTVRYQNGLDKNGNSSDGTFVHTFPDTLKTYTVNCYAYASGYYGLTATSDVTVVKGGLDGSITGTGILPSDSKVTFKGNDYYLTGSGNDRWFINSLSDGDAGAPYGNLEVMSDVFGRYYSYEEALTACPEGYRLPSDEDWVRLCAGLGAEASVHEDIKGVASDLMADVAFNGKKMWRYSREVGDIKATSGMAMFPAGYANLGRRSEDGRYPEASFDGVDEYAVFWTADAFDGENAYYRYLVAGQNDFLIGKGDRNSFGAMVRCIAE